jgi:hypothetical protein
MGIVMDFNNGNNPVIPIVYLYSRYCNFIYGRVLLFIIDCYWDYCNIIGVFYYYRIIGIMNEIIMIIMIIIEGKINKTLNEN